MSAAPTAAPLRVLLFNLRTDVDDTALGFTTAWINALARHCQSIDVVTMHQGTLDVAGNVRVHSLGRERGASRVRRVMRFYRLAVTVVIRRRPQVCFAHMTPLLASLFAPVARIARIPVLLWYAHGNVTRELRIAERLADRCATSTPNGFRLPSSKLVVLGQGVDTERFSPPAQKPPDYDRTILSIGRLTAAKHIDEALQALALMRPADMRLRVVGGPITEPDEDYEAKLLDLTRALELQDRVSFLGPVPFARISEEYGHGAVFLNLSTTGSLDKAILESMASGCIPVSRNDSFRAIAAEHALERLVPGPGPEGVAATLGDIAAMTPSERSALRDRLRLIVHEEHSLSRLAAAIYGELADLAARR